MSALAHRECRRAVHHATIAKTIGMMSAAMPKGWIVTALPPTNSARWRIPCTRGKRR